VGAAELSFPFLRRLLQHIADEGQMWEIGQVRDSPIVPKEKEAGCRLFFCGGALRDESIPSGFAGPPVFCRLTCAEVSQAATCAHVAVADRLCVSAGYGRKVRANAAAGKGDQGVSRLPIKDALNKTTTDWIKNRRVGPS
jgi:hypothetical protein